MIYAFRKGRTFEQVGMNLHIVMGEPIGDAHMLTDEAGYVTTENLGTGGKGQN